MRMRTVRVLCGIFLFSVASAYADGAATSGFRLALDLSDGSHIIGTTSETSLPVSMQFADLRLALTNLVTIQFGEEGGTSVFKLSNGDQLSGALKLNSFALHTVMGDVSVPIGHVRGVRVIPHARPFVFSPMGQAAFACRTGQARRAAIAKHGGTREAEAAVLRALRWLKANQLPDGSWPGHAGDAGGKRFAASRTAFTGLALLAFLGHGETSKSAEFGAAVEKGLSFLVKNQEETGRFKIRDGHDYTHSIATLALCEAYGLTANPDIRAAAQKAMRPIIKGQHPSGGWDYNMRQTSRDDTSYMGWCAQAVKAAYAAGVMEDKAQIQQVMKKAIDGFKKNAHPGGGFGYTGPRAGGLTGVGVTCMWLMGGADAAERKKGAAWLADKVPATWKVNPGSVVFTSPVYYWYYINQAAFFEGGKMWAEWNKGFIPELVTRQKKGQTDDTGYWQSPSEREHSGGNVQDTALCTLMLEVYYRMQREPAAGLK